MRSHLPEPVLMNVFTAKTNSSSVLQLHGRAQEQQMYGLVPNLWHHLTFQFSGSGQWSSPSVPLNSTLIELANRVTHDSTLEEETPLTDIWPYCSSHQLYRYSDLYTCASIKKVSRRLNTVKIAHVSTRPRATRQLKKIQRNFTNLPLQFILQKLDTVVRFSFVSLSINQHNTRKLIT